MERARARVSPADTPGRLALEVRWRRLVAETNKPAGSGLKCAVSERRLFVLGLSGRLGGARALFALRLVPARATLFGPELAGGGGETCGGRDLRLSGRRLGGMSRNPITRPLRPLARQARPGSSVSARRATRKLAYLAPGRMPRCAGPSPAPAIRVAIRTNCSQWEAHGRSLLGPCFGRINKCGRAGTKCNGRHNQIGRCLKGPSEAAPASPHLTSPRLASPRLLGVCARVGGRSRRRRKCGDGRAQGQPLIRGPALVGGHIKSWGALGK